MQLIPINGTKEIVVSLIDRNIDKISFPCRWGDFAVVSIRDVYMNGQESKLLTLTDCRNVENLPHFPIAQPNAYGVYNIFYY